MRNARITGIGRHVPPKVVTNADLTALIDTSDEWIQQRTGIQQRHYSEDRVGAADMGAIAAREALRILDLTEAVAAIALLAVCQCADLRGGPKSRASRKLFEAVRKHVPMLRGDRRQDADIARVADLVRARTLPLSPPSCPAMEATTGAAPVPVPPPRPVVMKTMSEPSRASQILSVSSTAA